MTFMMSRGFAACSVSFEERKSAACTVSKSGKERSEELRQKRWKSIEVVAMVVCGLRK